MGTWVRGELGIRAHSVSSHLGDQMYLKDGTERSLDPKKLFKALRDLNFKSIVDKDILLFSLGVGP